MIHCIVMPQAHFLVFVWASIGGNALQVTKVTDYFFQVTSTVTHCFLIYKETSELLSLKKVTPVTLFSHLLTDSSHVSMLREIRSKCISALCAL